MKLQRSTWVLMVIAIALGGGVLLYETQKGNNAEQTQGQSLYAFEENEVQQLKIDRDNDNLVFRKTDEGTWEMTAPRQQLAEAGAIAFLLDQVTGKPTIETLTVPANDLQKFGLASPSATVELILTDGSTHQLQVGNPDFSGDNLYVRRADDASAETEDIILYLVSGGLSNGIERPVEEWLIANEPESERPETATPSAPEASESETSESETPEPETSEPESPEN